MKRLWVIDPSLVTPEDEGVDEVVGDWEGEVRRFRPALDGDGPTVADGYPVDGVVLLGSAASVHDPAPWSDALFAWLRPIVSGDVALPLLGICYGHQVLAHLAGGGVDFFDAERTKRVAIESSRLAGGRLLPGASRLKVVVSHREHVTRVPAGWRTTATRPGVPCDGLEHPDLPIFGYQFHPEARTRFAERTTLGADAIDDEVRRDGRRLLAAFRESVTRSS